MLRMPTHNTLERIKEMDIGGLETSLDELVVMSTNTPKLQVGVVQHLGKEPRHGYCPHSGIP